MTTVRFLLLTTKAALLVLLATAAVILSQENSGAVSGIVIDARTQIPLSGIPVVMPGVGEAKTDETGRFRIANVSPGRHTIQAIRSGMASPLEDRSSGTVTIAPGEELLNVRLQLAPFGAVSGQIHDDQGNPLAGVSIQALVVNYQQGRRVLVAPSLPARILNSSTDTDEKGAYRLDLPPDVYFVCAQLRTPKAGDEGAARVYGGAPKTCYPGTSDTALAATVTVNGGETPGIDFNLSGSSQSLHKVYLRLQGADQASLNTVLTTAQVAELRDRFSLERMPILGGLRRGTSSQGLVIDGVPNGSYDLFLDGVMQGGGRGRGTVPLDVRGEDLHDVVVTLQPAQDISGRIVGADPSSPASFSSLMVRVGSRSARVEPNGAFVVPSVLSGFYSVSLDGLPPKGYVADIRYGGTSLHETAHSLNGPELQTSLGSTPLQIVVAHDGGSVEGIIEGREAAAGATVVLVPPPSRRFVHSYYKSAEASPAGAFSFRGIPPGVYQLFAWDSVPDTAWLNPEFMARWEGRGQAVVIEAGSIVNVRARLLSR